MFVAKQTSMTSDAAVPSYGVNNCWRISGISLLWTRLVSSTSLLMNRRGSLAAALATSRRSPSRSHIALRNSRNVGTDEGCGMAEFAEAVEVSHHCPVGIDSVVVRE